VTAPRVSVITIFLDAERFLEGAIDSVLRQTYPDWELILVDDGSRDGSSELARAASRQAPARLRVLEHPEHRNLGMSASRNRGLEAARGDLVTFLDADDTWKPEKLARQVERLSARPEAAGLVAPALYWYSWSGKEEDLARDFVQRWPFAAGQIVEPPALLEMFLADEWTSLCDVLLRRDSVSRIGGYEVPFAGMYEDQAFHAKLCSTYPLLVDDAPMYHYRQHPGSCTSRSHHGGSTRAARLRFLAWLETYLLEQDLERGATLDLVRRLRAAESAALDPIPTPETRTARDTGRRIASRWFGRRAEKRVTEIGSATRPVELGDLDRLQPFSRDFGFDRGDPVDRRFIENFLRRHSADIRGRVLEVGDDSYTRRFGGDRVSRADVLHVHADNPRATFVDDLARGDSLPSAAFDCIVLTQTLQYVFDPSAAVRTLARILAPGGVLLATVPGISQLSRDEWAETWYWSFTPLALRRLLELAFEADGVLVEAHGNVLTSVAFLAGLAAHEINAAAFEQDDPQYPLLVTARAVRAAT